MAKGEIKVSIILPCFNVGHFINRTYQSIKFQTISSWEAIFVDDGSNDNTTNELIQIQNKDKRIKIIQQKNAGSGAARNRGAEVAQGNFLYFMDPDDELKKNTLELLINTAEKNDSELTICGYQEIDVVNKNVKEFGITNLLTTKTNEEVKEIYSSLMDNRIFNPPWNKLFLTKFWKENNLEFPTVKKGQDALLNMIAFKHLERMTVIPDKLYCYYIGRVGSAQTTLSDNDFEYFEINQAYEKELMFFWEMYSENYFIERTVSFCFADSVKVYRYVKSRNEGIKQFVELWNGRRGKAEIENICLCKVFKNKQLLIKLISMKLPSLNYFIQKKISK